MYSKHNDRDAMNGEKKKRKDSIENDHHVK